MTETTYTNPNGEWHVLDASKIVLGRLATEAAGLLLGKHRTDFAKNTVAPVHVIVINSDNVQVTGRKMDQKMYRKYSGYPGGLRERNMKDQVRRDSTMIIYNAVSGMLPKNNLRDDRLRHLKVYTGAEHPHIAQTAEATKK